MPRTVAQKLADLERKLWVEFRATPVFPARVPEPIQLMLLRQQYRTMLKETPTSETRPEAQRSNVEFHTAISFCQGWCPGCKLLEWCDYTEGRFTPDQIAWMKKHRDYPPDCDDPEP